MKKQMVFALCTLLLCGCAATRQDDAVQKVLLATSLPFSFSGTLTLEELEQPIGITVQRGADIPIIELTSPQEVAGLRLEFDEATVRLGYCGLVLNLAPGDLPQYSVFAALADMLGALPLPQESLRHAGDVLVLEGREGMTAFSMVWSGDGNVLRSILLPGAGAVIQVTDFKNEDKSSQ